MDHLPSMSGFMMVDTGAAVMLVSEGWCDSHHIKVRWDSTGGALMVGANNLKLQITGTTSFLLQLTPTLELEVTNVAVQKGSFYSGLLGCDILQGVNG